MPCTYNGELVQGAEYVYGQYTYRYMQQGNTSGWENISTDGWGVILTNKDSTEPVTSNLCSSINDKPIVSMSLMFVNSEASNINLSNFNTSNVVNMNGMFKNTKVNNLNLSNFDTSNVTDMQQMFDGSLVENLNIDSFDTSSVTNMNRMFAGSAIATFDLTNFDTSNVTDMQNMFINATTTIGYAKTQADADRLNASAGKPSGLTFTVKNN